MRLPGKVRLGLAAKLAVCVIASTAAFFALFGYINLRMARTNSEGLVRKSADRLANIMLRSTRYAMLQDDRAALVSIIQDLGSEPGIQRIRIFDQNGRITLSTDSREVGSSDSPGPEGVRIFKDPKAQRVLAVNRPIENSPSCSSASCHVHPASQKTLGMIDADLSLAQVDAQMAQQQQALRWYLFGAILFGCAAALAFMWVAVYRPVKELIRGTHRVAGGDLEYRLPVRS